MVYQGTGKHQEVRRELKRDQKGRTVGRKNKLKSFNLYKTEIMSYEEGIK
jgi:hypothetical protein